MSTATLPSATPTPRTRRRQPGRIGGWVLIGLGVLVLMTGGGMFAAHFAGRDADGYFSSPDARVAAPGYAVASQQLDLADLGAAENLVSDVVGRVRVEATSARERPVFVGIAPQGRVDRYLDGVSRSEVTDVHDNGHVEAVALPGDRRPAPPAEQGFWAASATGTGTQALTWKVQEGRWAVVVMNADGSRGVAADITVGAKSNIVLWLAIGLTGLALVIGGVGAALLVSSGRSPRPDMR
jgi:hypothetical protein